MSSSRQLVVPVLVAVALLFASSASAQSHFGSTHNFGGPTIHGVPPSVTSFGFGGSPGFHGTPPSVTSLNFGNMPHPVHPIFHPGFGFHNPAFGFNHHHGNGFVTPIFGSFYVPYAYPVYVMDYPVDDSMAADYASRPVDRSTIDAQEMVRHELDSLRSEIEDYRADLYSQRQAEQAPTKPEAQEPQIPTVLVFKDGHQLEVTNYAIVGNTLYDVSGGRTKKVALAELDLPATVKQNDQRGLDFRVPATVN